MIATATACVPFIFYPRWQTGIETCDGQGQHARRIRWYQMNYREKYKQHYEIEFGSEYEVHHIDLNHPEAVIMVSFIA